MSSLRYQINKSNEELYTHLLNYEQSMYHSLAFLFIISMVLVGLVIFLLFKSSFQDAVFSICVTEAILFFFGWGFISPRVAWKTIPVAKPDEDPDLATAE